MAPDLVREAVAEHVREVVEQQTVAPGVIRELAGEKFVRQEVLRVRQQDGELRRRQPVAVGPTFRQFLVVGKVFDDAVDLVAELEPAQVPLMDVDQRRCLHNRVDQRLVLSDVVSENEIGDVIRHRCRKTVPRCLAVRSLAATTASSTILMLTSRSEQSTPAELSMASVLI